MDDNDRDPYSARRGLWFSHMGWMLRNWPSGKEDLSNVQDLMRDPIVAVNPGSADLLLGWSYLDLGRVQVGTPSFFSLERDVPLTHLAPVLCS